MAPPGAARQPSHDPLLQKFNWLIDHLSEPVYHITKDEKVEPGIVPIDALEDHFRSRNYPNLDDILHAIFEIRPGSRQPRISPKDVAENCIRILCILFLIGKAKFIETFVQHKDLHDCHLPFLQKPFNFPSDPSDNEGQAFFREFHRTQWRFCSPVVTPLSHCTLPSDAILPFMQWNIEARGRSGIVYKAILHSKHNGLSKGQHYGTDAAPGTSSQTVSDCFAVKTFKRRNAHQNYQRESEAFTQVTKERTKATEGIIQFFCGFEYNETFNIVLEYADAGTLGDYFKLQTPPSTPEETFDFWKSLLEITKGVCAINQQYFGPTNDRSESRVQGWHQDLKPDNILVVSGGEHSVYRYSFKVADLGHAHFKTILDGENNVVDLNTFGTTTYGAPECCGQTDWDQFRRLYIGDKVDVWSLGCIFSETAVWIANGNRGLEDYRRRRQAANSSPGFDGSDCFHDRVNRLPVIDDVHEETRGNLPTPDFVTGKLIERMVEDMLDVDTAQRLTVENVHSRADKILAQAQIRLKNNQELSQKHTRTLPLILDDPRKISQSPRSTQILPGPFGPDEENATSGDQPVPFELSQTTVTNRRAAIPVSPTLSPITQTRISPPKRPKSKGSNPYYCSVKDLADWYNRVKAERNRWATQLPHGDMLMKELKDRDYVYMIDDSGSMGRHRQQVYNLVRYLSYLTKSMDPNGQNLLFLSDKTSYEFKRSSQLADHVRSHRYKGITKLGKTLEVDLRDYQRKIERNLSVLGRLMSTPRQRSIYVFTDGLLQLEDDSSVIDAIRSLVQKLKEANLPREQIGIQLISFGSDKAGLRRLRHLDRLKKEEGLDLDIVDTEPSTGNIWKMLLGAINSKFDDDDDDDVEDDDEEEDIDDKAAEGSTSVRTRSRVTSRASNRRMYG